MENKIFSHLAPRKGHIFKAATRGILPLLLRRKTTSRPFAVVRRIVP